MPRLKTLSRFVAAHACGWHESSKGNADRFKMGQKNTKEKMKELRIGFVPLCDCAPLVVASEFGFFEKHGLRVKLSREIGWASLRDKLLYGALEAAHALAPMVFAATAGLGSPAVPCLTGLVINLHGNA